MKKGDVSFQTVLLILIMVSLGVLLYFVYELGVIGQDLTGRERCREAFIIKDIKIAGQSLPISSVSENCKTNLAVVNSKEKEEVMQKIADEIFWCIWQTNGKDPTNNWLSSSNTLKNGPLAESGYCLPCSVIEFEDNANDLGFIDIKTEFIPFLKTTYLSDEQILNNSKVSYYDYFYQGQYVGRDREEIYISENTRIDLSKPLNVYYVIGKSQLTLTHHLRNLIKDGDTRFYTMGLKLAANSLYTDKIAGVPDLDGAIVSSVLTFQEPIGDLNPANLCDVDLVGS